MWMSTMHVMVLMVSFAINTYRMCQRYSGPEVAFCLLYSMFWLLCVVLTPAWFYVDIFHFVT